MLAALVLLVVCAGAAIVLATAAPPAHAFSQWAHDGISPGTCPCHVGGQPTDASCTSCHTGYVSVPGQNCWSCHYPGQDTSSLSSPSSACTAGCHLYSPVTRAYTEPFAHSTNPHLGSDPDCLACHQTSPGVADPGQSPHHNPADQGFTDCSACHTGFAKHAGQVVCAKCHATAAAFHLYQATSPGFKNCRSCHAMKHAGKAVPQSKCAACHKGTGTGGGAQAQHSATVTKGRVCSACHTQKLHATAKGSHITKCGACHKGLYHAKQATPGKSVCTRCHTTANRHADGFQCYICHRSLIHNVRPSVPKIRGL